jgi:hypothetical protein
MESKPVKDILGINVEHIQNINDEQFALHYLMP